MDGKKKSNHCHLHPTDAQDTDSGSPLAIGTYWGEMYMQQLVMNE